jgi:prepilin-type N-terminal cleavage/methylation domain-containing protein
MKNRYFGFTLTEVMASVAIIVVVAIGTLGYQYNGVKFSRASQAQITGTRLGQIVLEDWKSTGGDADYNPTTLGLGFAETLGTETGNCKITLDSQTFYIEMQLTQIAEDTVAGVKLNQIRVIVRWRKDFTSGAIGGEDPQVTLTTYVRRNQD